MEETPLLEWRYVCTQEELLSLLRRGEPRRAGKTRLRVETVVLVVLALYNLVAFFGGGLKDFRTLGIAIAALAVGVILLVVPEWRFRQEARELAGTGKKQHVRLYEEGFAFGESDEALPFEECRPQMFSDMVIFRFEGDLLLCLPKRVMPEEEWRLLCEKLPAKL